MIYSALGFRHTIFPTLDRIQTSSQRLMANINCENTSSKIFDHHINNNGIDQFSIRIYTREATYMLK